MTLPPQRSPYKAAHGLPGRAIQRTPVPVGVAGVFSRTAKGETSYTSAGTYSFVVPKNVRYISAVCVGYGGNVISTALGGNGGGCAWRNRIPVTPGETLTVVVQNPGLSDGHYVSAIFRGNALTGDMLCGASAATISGPGRPIVGQGGAGGLANADGGAGAGGYAGDGGTNTQDATGGAGAGAGVTTTRAGGGGGVGLTGLTTAWTYAAAGSTTQGGGAGVGGNSGTNGTASTVCVGCPPTPCTTYSGGNGGNYGGGAGGGNCSNGSPGVGAVRIIWPGETRTFPYNGA